jgi:hypothetical protein
MQHRFGQQPIAVLQQLVLGTVTVLESAIPRVDGNQAGHAGSIMMAASAQR